MVSRKRKVEDLQDDSDMLHELIEAIRTPDDESLRNVVTLIKGGASKEQIRQAITQHISQHNRGDSEPQGDLALAQRNGEAVDERWRQKQKPRKHGVLDVIRLTDEPPFRVPAAPWTSVTVDDSLVSNLVSLYLTWEKAWYNFFEEDLFIRDMQSANLTSKYCSPFMVNALLAVACPYSDFEEAATIGGSVSPLMVDFFAEAERLLEAVDRQPPSITTVQGLGLMFSAASLMGKDRQGYYYARETVSAVNALMKAHDSMQPPELSRALDTTCWGIFNVMAVAYLSWEKPAEMLPPARSKPAIVEDVYSWMPYPHPGEARQAHIKEMLHIFCEIAVILHDITQLLFGGKLTDSAPPLPQLMDLHGQILSWRRSLPEHLVPTPDSPPSVFARYLSYLGIVLKVSSVCAAWSQPGTTSAADNAAREVAQITEIYMSSHGHCHVNPIHLPPMQAAMLVLFAEPVDESTTTAMASILICLRSMAQRWPFVMAILRMIQLTGQQQAKTLPPTVELLFKDFETQDWTRRGLKTVDSIMPVPKIDDFVIANLTEFLEHLDMDGR